MIGKGKNTLIISSKNGDRGFTQTLKIKSILKTDSSVKFLGEIDELSSFIGVAHSFSHNELTKKILVDMQQNLSALMALAAGSESSSFGKEQIEWLDITNEDLSRQIKKPGQFIFNFHKSSSAFINVARAVTRRVERSAVHLAQNNALARSDIMLPYLNRLSTLLFSLMIFEEQEK